MNFHDRLRSAVSAGAAIELLLKYILLLRQPLYLQELKPKDARSAWRTRELLAEHAESYDSSLVDVKSVSAFEALEMARSLYPALNPISAVLGEALQVRNAAIHLAVLSSEESMDDAVYAVIMLFRFAHDLSLMDETPLGVEEARTERFVRSYRERRLEHVQAKVALAKLRQREQGDAWQRERRDRSEEVSFFLHLQYRAILGEEELSMFRGHATYEEQKCVACGQDASIVIEESGDVEEVMIDGEWRDSPVVIQDVLAFGCAYCGLTLTYTELKVLATEGNSAWAARLSEQRVVHTHKLRSVEGDRVVDETDR